jgi:apolipoprotein N-acyltransferase
VQELSPKPSFRAGWAGAALSGVLLYLCFPPVGAGFLIPLAPIPLLLALAQSGVSVKRAVAVGYFSHVVFFLLLLRWLLHLDESALPYPQIRLPVWILASAYLAVYGALFGLATVGLARLWRASPLFFAAPVWVALEFLRGLGDLGFTWGQASYALAQYPVAIQAASLGGVGLVSMLVIGTSSLLAASLKTRGTWPLLAAVCLVALVLVHGLLCLNVKHGGELLGVVVVQPNMGTHAKWQQSRLNENVRVLGRLTAEASRENPELIVWPETAALVDLTVRSYTTNRIRKMAREAGSYLLAGFPRYERGSAHNSAALISPDGEILDLYDKIHPVPFSERMPLGPAFSWVDRLNLGQSNFASGTRATVFELPRGRFGVLICFESTFSELARRLVLEGAEFLVVITNDAWFGREAGSAEQHAAMAVLRSVETRVSLVRAGNTGITTFIDPYGRAVSRAPAWQEATLWGQVRLNPVSTLYLRLGEWVALLCAMGTCTLLVVGAIRDRRRRGSQTAN